MLLRSVPGGGKSRPRPAPAGQRLLCELLEDRSVPSGYVQTNLASDIPGQAQFHDTNLVDAARSDPQALLRAKVRYTIVGGRIVYEADR